MKIKTSAKSCGTQTLALATSLIAATSAWADTTATTANITTEQVQPSFWEQAAERTQLKIVSYFNGPALNNWGNSVNPQFQANPALPTFDYSNRGNFDNFVITGYRIPQSNWIVGIGDEMKVYLGSNDPYETYVAQGYGPHAADQGQLLSPFLRVANAKIYTNGGFTLGGDIFRAYLPLAYDLQEAGIQTILRSDWVATYDVPNSRLSLGAFFSERWYINDATAPSNLVSQNTTRLRTVFSMFGSYQMAERVSATIWADLVSARNYYGQDFTTYANNTYYDEAADIQPGINIDITKNFSVNPYINVFPDHPTIDATSIGAILVYKPL